MINGQTNKNIWADREATLKAKVNEQPFSGLLISTTVDEPLAQAVAEVLNTRIMDAGGIYFGNGEFGAKLAENIRGQDVVIIGSISRSLSHHSPADALMEILILANAAQLASARSISIVCPYLGYGKADKKKSGRESITMTMVASMLEMNSRVCRISVVDLHALQIQGFFKKIPCDALTAQYYIFDLLRHLGYHKRKTVFVTPDAGGFARADKAGQSFLRRSSSLVVVHKERVNPQSSEVVMITGNYQGKVCVIWDDMAQTGSTFINAADALIKGGAKEVIVCVTHPDFTHKAGFIDEGQVDRSIEDFMRRLEQSAVHKLIVTDTIPIARHPRVQESEKVLVVPIHTLIAEAIWTNHTNGSLSATFH